MPVTRPAKDFRHIAASVIVILAFVALMVLVVSSRDAAPRPQNPSAPQITKHTLSTAGGDLSVTGTGDLASRVFVVQLANKTITTIKDAQDVHIYAYFKSYQIGDIVVLSVLSGGNACPAGFHVLEIKSSTKYYLTKEFGDCADSPVLTFDQNNLKVRFPGYYQLHQESEPGFKRPAATTYLYRTGGKLTRL